MRSVAPKKQFESFEENPPQSPFCKGGRSKLPPLKRRVGEDFIETVSSIDNPIPK
jgi:hypothetical protein